MFGDEALNANQVAEILHIGRNGVYALAKSGQLPSYKIGRKLLFALADVQEYLSRQRRDDSASGRIEASGVSSETALASAKANAEEPPANGTFLGAEAASLAVLSSAGREKSGFAASPTFAAPSRNSFVIAGHGIAVDMFVERLEMMGQSVVRCPCTSYEALCGIYTETVDGAFVHLFDQRTNSYNVPYVQRLAPGTPVTVFRLLSRRQGFAVQRGNPKSITSWGGFVAHGNHVGKPTARQRPARAPG